MKQHRWTAFNKTAAALVLSAGMIFSSCAPVLAAEEEAEVTHQLSVGTAIRDITPTEENGLLPIDGVGRTTLVGVLDPIHLRVISFYDGEETALFVSIESGKATDGPVFVEALSEHTGIPVDHIYYTATHAHAVPEITDTATVLDYDEDDPDVTNLQKWGNLVKEQLFSAADEALSDMEPATMGIGYSESYINVNRNRWYLDEDGNPVRKQGYDPTGVSDKTVAAIEFDNLDGEPIAFLFHYAIHGVTMYANQCYDGQTGVSSDIPGYVSTALETANEGAVACFISGAAGDQNPIFGNEYFTPNPEDGTQETTYIEGGNYDIMVYLGKLLYSDVCTALGSIDEMTGDVDISCSYGETSIPATEEYAGENGTDEFALALSVLRLGDVALVGSPGELFCSIGIDMKENATMENVLICNHVWTQEDQYNGYLPDDLGCTYGGQGVRTQNYQAGYISSALSILMNDLIAETE